MEVYQIGKGWYHWRLIWKYEVNREVWNSFNLAPEGGEGRE